MLRWYCKECTEMFDIPFWNGKPKCPYCNSTNIKRLPVNYIDTLKMINMRKTK